MRVSFEGTIHDFPDDFTTAEVQAALSGYAPASGTSESPPEDNADLISGGKSPGVGTQWDTTGELPEENTDVGPTNEFSNPLLRRASPLTNEQGAFELARDRLRANQTKQVETIDPYSGETTYHEELLPAEDRVPYETDVQALNRAFKETQPFTSPYLKQGLEKPKYSDAERVSPGVFLPAAFRGAVAAQTGVGAFLAGGLTYLGTLAASGDPDAAAAVSKAVGEKVTYTPPDELGQELADTFGKAISTPFEGWKMMADIAGPWVYEKTGSPILAASIATILEATPFIAIEAGRARPAFEYAKDQFGKATTMTFTGKRPGETIVINAADLAAELRNPGSTLPTNVMEAFYNLSKDNSPIVKQRMQLDARLADLEAEGKQGTPEYKSLFDQASQLTDSESLNRARAIKEGLNITIPESTVKFIMDKPWFQEIKGLFNVEPRVNIVRTGGEKALWEYAERSVKDELLKAGMPEDQASLGARQVLQQGITKLIESSPIRPEVATALRGGDVWTLDDLRRSGTLRPAELAAINEHPLVRELDINKIPAAIEQAVADMESGKSTTDDLLKSIADLLPEVNKVNLEPIAQPEAPVENNASNNWGDPELKSILERTGAGEVLSDEEASKRIYFNYLSQIQPQDMADAISRDPWKLGWGSGAEHVVNTAIKYSQEKGHSDAVDIALERANAKLVELKETRAGRDIIENRLKSEGRVPSERFYESVKQLDSDIKNFEQAKSALEEFVSGVPEAWQLTHKEAGMSPLEHERLIRTALDEGLPVPRKIVSAHGLENHPMVGWNDALQKGIIDEAQHAAVVNINAVHVAHGIDTPFEFHNEATTALDGTPLKLDLTNPDHVAIAKRQGFTEEQLYGYEDEKGNHVEGVYDRELSNTSSGIRIKGEYDRGQIADERGGGRRTGKRIMAYNGAGIYDYYHELVHSLVEEGIVQVPAHMDEEAFARAAGKGMTTAAENGKLDEYIENLKPKYSTGESKREKLIARSPGLSEFFQGKVPHAIIRANAEGVQLRGRDLHGFSLPEGRTTGRVSKDDVANFKPGDTQLGAVSGPYPGLVKIADLLKNWFDYVGGKNEPTTGGTVKGGPGAAIPKLSAGAGGAVAAPARSYPEAAKREGNPWVKLSDNPSNKGRTLMIQFTTDLMGASVDKAAELYDKQYSGARPGYKRAVDFWEIPQWAANIKHMAPDSDFYVVRDMDAAKTFLESSGYDHVVFSSMDVNKGLIKELAESFPGKVDIGGYVKPENFKDIGNARWNEDLPALAKNLGVEFKAGTDYSHFKGTEIIPRLTMSTGCKYKCAFCAVVKKVEMTPTDVIDQQVDSFKDLDAKLIYLNDKTFGQSPNHKYLSDVYEKLKAQNPEFEGFIVQTTASDLMKMPEEFLKKSGIKYVELGVESFNDLVLRGLHKPHNVRIIELATDKLRKLGINLVPNVIIGIPEETPETYKNTLDYLKRNQDVISHANIYNLSLMEGTEMTARLAGKGEQDINQNVGEKSFHKDEQIHQDFADKVYQAMSDRLDEPAKFSARASDLDEAIKDAESDLREATTDEEIADAEDRLDQLKRQWEPIKFSAREGDPFYSQLTRVAEATELPSKSQSLVPYLLKKGVKPAELEWMGVEQWVKENQKDGKIDRDAFREFLAQNQIKMEEITKGDNTYAGASDNPDDYLPEGATRRDAQGLTKFSQWVLPGGTNYREILFQLPRAVSGKKSETIKWGGDGHLTPRVEVSSTSDYKSAHWDEPNVVGHIRMNDRQSGGGPYVVTVSEPGPERKGRAGKTTKTFDTEEEAQRFVKVKKVGGYNTTIEAQGKTLFLEELQSDWHQEGKKKGYQGESKIADVRADANVWVVYGTDRSIPETFGTFVDVPKRFANNAEEARAYAAAHPELTRHYGTPTMKGAPPAPFAKNWHELLFKRMLRHAAENGYDKLAWTTGAQQADRYDLSKQLTEVRWKNVGTSAKDRYHIAFTTKSGDRHSYGTSLYAEGLPDVVGKELADKIIQSREESGEFSGLDLRVGGEGMVVFYDKLIPGFAEKYVKQWGSKVGTTEITTDSPEIASKYEGNIDDFEDLPEKMTVHSVDITPAMRESVMQGQPLFSAGEGAPKEFKGKQITLTHWTTQPRLTKTDPKFQGTGSPGTEKYSYTDRYFTKITYFGVPPYKREFFVNGPLRYSGVVDGDKIYDLEKDPLGLWPTPEQLKKKRVPYYERKSILNLYTKNIKDAGFDGFYARSANAVGMFVPVAVKQEKPGDKSVKFSYSADEVKSPEREITDVLRPAIGTTWPEMMPLLKQYGWSDEKIEGLSKVKVHNLLKAFDEAPPEETLESLAKLGEVGAKWYTRTFIMLTDFFGADAPMVARLIAALSPQNSVSENLYLAFDATHKFKQLGPNPARDAVERAFKTLATTKVNQENAVRAVMGEELGEPGGAFKIKNFARNLMNIMNGVTLDVWMSMIGGYYTTPPGQMLAKEFTVKGDPRYAGYATKVIKVANEIEWGPMEVQAASWMFTKSLYEAMGKFNAEGYYLKHEPTQRGWKQALASLTEGHIVQASDLVNIILEDLRENGKLTEALGKLGITSETIRALQPLQAAEPGRKVAAGMDEVSNRVVASVGRTLETIRRQRDRETEARAVEAVRYDKPPTSFIFASENQRVGTDVKDVMKGMTSADVKRYEKIVQDILDENAVEHRSFRAMGDWTDGMESAVYTEVTNDVDYDKLRLVAAKMGLARQQKQVPVFQAGKGRDKLYVMDLPAKDLADLRKVLTDNKIEYRTIVPRKDGNFQVIIFDSKGKLESKVKEVGKHYGIVREKYDGTEISKIETYKGRGEFVGGETRAEAAKVFKDIITEQEGDTSFEPLFSAGEGIIKEGKTPKVFYRGSKSETGKAPFFFTDNLKAAKKYGAVQEVNLLMKSPKIIDYRGKEDNDLVYDIEDAQDEGYDGLIAKNTFDGWSTHDQYIVFNKDQIKSTPIDFESKQLPEESMKSIGETFFPEDVAAGYMSDEDLRKMTKFSPEFKDHLAGALSALDFPVTRRLTPEQQSLVSAVTSAALARFRESGGNEKTVIPAIKELGFPVDEKQTIKNLVRTMTGQVKVNDLDMKEYDALVIKIKAEAAAARKAFVAGKYEAAAKTTAKYRMMIDIAREKRKQGFEVKKMITGMGKAAKLIPEMTPEYGKKVEELLAPFDLTKMTEKTRLKLSDLRKELETNPDADVSEDMMNALERLDKTAVRDLTLGDLRTLHDAVMHYATLGVRGPKMIVAQRTIAREMVLDQSLKQMRPLNEVGRDLIDITYSKGKSIKAALTAVKNQFGIHSVAWDALVESVTGMNSMFYKIIYREVKDGIKARDLVKFEIEDQHEEITKAFIKDHPEAKDIASWLDKVEDIKLPNGQTLRLNRNQKLSFYRGFSDPDWRKAVEEGGFGLWADPNKTNPNRVYKLGVDGYEAIMDTMTPAEKEYADLHIPIIVRTGKLLADKFLEINGYNMPMPDSGVYWRKDVMSIERGAQDEKTMEERQRFGRPGIFKGMTKQRVGSTAAVWLKPFSVAMGETIKRSADYVGLEEVMANAGWLLYKLRTEFEPRYGDPLWKEIEKGLKDISEVTSTEMETAMDAAARKLRNNQTVYGLALNYGSWLKQANGLLNFLVFTTPKDLAWALVQYAADRNGVKKLHREMSVEYRKRGEEGYSMEVGNVISGLSKYGQKPDMLKRFGRASLKPMQQMDLFGVSVGMLACVEEALNAFKLGKMPHIMRQALDLTDEQVKAMTYGEQYKLAYQWADWVTERSQNMNTPEHMSGWQRGTELEKQFSMFFGELGKNVSGIVRAWNHVKRDDPGGKKLLAKTLFYYILIGTVLMDTGVNAFRDWARGRKPDAWWSAILKNIAGHIPIFRDLVSAVLDRITGRNMSGAGGDTPAARFEQALVKPADAAYMMTKARTYQEKKKAMLAVANSAADLVSIGAGIPYPGLKEPIRILNRQQTMREQKHYNR